MKTLRRASNTRSNKELVSMQVMAFLNSLDCRDDFLVKKIRRTKEFKAFIYQKEILDLIPPFPYFKK
ncbi:hypothetical protein OQH61_03655 [Helicobacter sp. MIT 21-1697]|uniref:hypothetical protein n=1 Tax=Helicobacter sp. MIT 21-1697 TaxID=2993733 RepID=UPI00224B57BF|nr:hypothetical protein [Helicobacter sp. MIT 21-1697]MCX2716830.1 hypothetical protein [Helicobacter sp. MIT 21-1697]